MMNKNFQTIYFFLKFATQQIFLVKHEHPLIQIVKYSQRNQFLKRDS